MLSGSQYPSYHPKFGDMRLTGQFGTVLILKSQQLPPTAGAASGCCQKALHAQQLSSCITLIHRTQKEPKQHCPSIYSRVYFR